MIPDSSNKVVHRVQKLQHAWLKAGGEKLGPLKLAEHARLQTAAAGAWGTDNVGASLCLLSFFPTAQSFERCREDIQI
ncbi:hypothetical protein ACLOJK_035733 [Asimina triloba]